MIVPDSPPHTPSDTYEPTLWCGPCDTAMLLSWIPDTPAWRFICPSCSTHGQVLP